MSQRADIEAQVLATLRRLESVLARWEATGLEQPLQLGGLQPRRLLQRLERDSSAALTAAESHREPHASPPVSLIGKSAALRAVLTTLKRIGPRDSSVLVQGESGTGKELVARAIHQASPRSGGPFVAVDCGSLPDTLLETELFGHRKGSFTGASMDRTGLLEEADGGTLFLDEIANASNVFQTRLLRVLQEHEIRRVGENRTVHVNFRVVAATSGRLPELMAAGRFREDLYYRLNVVSLNVPPLRQRKEDIVPLVDHFLIRACSRHALPVRSFTPAATEILLRYSWPGNIRELENVVERSVLLAPGKHIDPSLLPAGLLDALLNLEGHAGSTAIKNGEQRLIEKALLQAGGDKTRAAKIIGWHRTKLYRRLRRYGIPYDLGKAVVSADNRCRTSRAGRSIS